MFNELILKNRSYRRFDESVRINLQQLDSLIDLARLSPSSRNQQALKFARLCETDQCERMFRHLAWAGYLPDWDGPIVGERPSGYIVILGDKNLGSQFQTDMGIAAQSILLGAVEVGLGGCMIGSIKRKELRDDLRISDELEVLLVIAIGKPIEKVVIQEMEEGDIKYYRDEEGTHYVPKRRVCDIIVEL